MCDFPVLPSAEDGLNLVDNGEEMGGLSLVLCILQCAPWPRQKAVTHQSTLCRKSLLVFFGPSPSCNSRLKKIMQLCSCLDQSSKEDESSSAKTFYHWTPKDPARAFLYVGTSDHTPSIKFTTSLQLLRPGCNLGPLSNVTEQLLGPLVSKDLGFQICHYWSPTASPNLTPHELQGLQSHTRDRWHIAKNHSCPLFWGRTDQVRGVLGPVTYWLWFYRKTWLGKLREKCTPCHSSSDTGSEKSLLVVRCLSTPLTKLLLLRPVTQYSVFGEIGLSLSKHRGHCSLQSAIFSWID